jgi:hypothetical protein
MSEWISVGIAGTRKSPTEIAADKVWSNVDYMKQVNGFNHYEVLLETPYLIIFQFQEKYVYAYVSKDLFDA